ncbi:hypothetical protein FHS29_003394 [Saccharothrix tamanrassetensis]|uniref:Tissue inhibitor of metalloproteinase n=1 Tax=Saccharothrix tamanrassetensis TaxID=1051531 RepID=A0A841CHD9_9PSEU|nr:hypothetical protein [Saccharothrix tamanrassetensis]MBB5956801.1 hypothetical protein [Saccharothrix tamanrassetensis]
MARLRFLAHAAAVTTLAAGLLTAVFTGTASACSCLPDGEGLKYLKADHVFVALVTSERLDKRDPNSGTDDRYVYTTKVFKEYKGDVPRRVEITTHYQGTACGIRLVPGTKYLVFAHGDSSDRQVDSNQCSGTRLASGGPPTTTPGSGTSTPPTTPCATAIP